MDILVTGSEGTIGRPLCVELERRGHLVTRADLMHREGVVRCDIKQYRQVYDLIDTFRPEVVFHLAAEFGRMNGEHYYEQVWETNVIGTRHLLEVQRKLGFRMVFASSSEVYGELPSPAFGLYEGMSNEVPLRQLNDYAISKYVNEQQIMNMEARSGAEVMRLRFFNAYGPGERFHPYRSVVCLFVHAALHGYPFTVYDGYKRVFMYIDDFVPTLANAADLFVAGAVVNIGGAEFRTVNDLAQVVLAATGGDPALVKYVSADLHNTFAKKPDIGLARKLLKHNPTVPLEEGVARTVAWMRSEATDRVA